MPLSNFLKSCSTIGLIATSNLIVINSASAFSVTFSNGGFEDSTNGWSTIGDVTTTGTFDGIAPITGSEHAIITNAVQNSTRIDDVDNTSNSLSYNQSGIDPVSADTNPNADDLQEFFGLSTNSLSIPRENASSDFTGDPRTSKEGSGLFQDVSISISDEDVASGNNGFEISFNWAYLTNDGHRPIFGDQDFGFFSIYETSEAPSNITILADSQNPLSDPTLSDTVSDNFVYEEVNNYDPNNPFITSISNLPAGDYNYQVGFGVVDVDGTDRSSGMLIDDFRVRQVPFEFSPSLGILMVFSMFGYNRLRKFKSNRDRKFS